MGFGLLAKAKHVFEKYPITRGMASYSLLWPSSNLVQQGLDPNRHAWDPLQTARFLVVGSFLTAPTVFVWVKIAGKMVKGTTLGHAMLKALYDVTLFAPVGQTQFYFTISLLEGRPIQDCVQEVKDKLIPSWKVACCYWPFVQTFNFYYVAERNRVMVVSMGSFLWTVFLSYMHHSDCQALPNFFRPKNKQTIEDQSSSPTEDQSLSPTENQ